MTATRAISRVVSDIIQMRRPPTSWFRIATAILAFCAGTGIARADSLTLAWDRNAEPEVTGYVVYIGNAPGAYTQQVDVGNALEYVLSVTPGQQYCFAVSAYIPGPIEGERSPDVCATVGRRRMSHRRWETLATRRARSVRRHR